MLVQKALQDKIVHTMKIFDLSVKIGVFPSKVPVSGLKIRRQCCFATFGSFLAILAKNGPAQLFFFDFPPPQSPFERLPRNAAEFGLENWPKTPQKRRFQGFFRRFFN